MKHPRLNVSTILLPVAGALLLCLAPAQGGEIPGKTNITGFYPTWYFPGHRTCHGTQWAGTHCGYRPWCRPVATPCAYARDDDWRDDGVVVNRRGRRGAVVGGTAVGLATGSWAGAAVGAVAGAAIANRRGDDRWDRDDRYDRRHRRHRHAD